MNCLKAKREKNKLTAEDKKAISKAVSDYLTDKWEYWRILEYIHSQSWDEKDFEVKMKHYRETGELPKKVF